MGVNQVGVLMHDDFLLSVPADSGSCLSGEQLLCSTSSHMQSFLDLAPRFHTKAEVLQRGIQVVIYTLKEPKKIPWKCRATDHRCLSAIQLQRLILLMLEGFPSLLGSLVAVQQKLHMREKRLLSLDDLVPSL